MQKLQLLHLFLNYKIPKTMKILTLIGALIILSKIYRFIRFIYKNFIRSQKNFLHRYGANSWVFISGSSEGIGRAFAHAFAKRNFNIILSSRNKQKLEKVQKELLLMNPKIEVKMIVIDYRQISEEKVLEGLRREIQNLDISVLINNVGVDLISYYTHIKQQQIINLIKTNCMPQAILTRLLLPQFINRKHKSAIINLSSIASQQPMALHNIYSASKIFNDYLSRSLNYQYPDIDIISLRPSIVSTNMTFQKRDIFSVQAQNCVQGLLRDLGHQNISNGHLSHQLQSLIYGSVPEQLFNYIFKNIIGVQFMKERAHQKIKLGLFTSEQR